MERIETAEDFSQLKDNSFAGTPPNMNNSSITIKGKGNHIYIESGTTLDQSRITFEGDNGLIMLGSSRHAYRIETSINTNCSIVFGRDNYFNGACHIIVSEGRSVVFGDDCLLSFGVWIRTADPHLVFDCETHERINYSKDVVVGDHVWIGQDAMMLKGTTIGSGSIVGAMALVSGKRIPSNTCWGGNPAKQIKSGIFWEGSCVHTWTPKKTKAHANWEGSEFIFNQDETCLLTKKRPFPKSTISATDRCEWHRDHGYDNRATNRFAIEQQPPEKDNGRIRNIFGLRGGSR